MTLSRPHVSRECGLLIFMIVDLIKYCYNYGSNIYQHVNDFPTKILISALHRACCGRTKFGFINVGNVPVTPRLARARNSNIHS